jgi:hypothetical protein
MLRLAFKVQFDGVDLVLELVRGLDPLGWSHQNVHVGP